MPSSRTPSSAPLAGPTADAIRTTDLTTLVVKSSSRSRSTTPAPSAGASSDPLTSTATATVTTSKAPSADDVLDILQARARQELPYSFVGARTLVVVNPLKNLGSSNDAVAEAIAKRTLLGSTDDRQQQTQGSSKTATTTANAVERWIAQPSPYELAGRAWREMVVKRQDAAVVFHGITNSGKTYASRLFTNQILRLSAYGPNNKPSRLANQVLALGTLLDSFGAAKTASNASASQHGRYLELFFSSSISEHATAGWADAGPSGGGGRLTGAKLLTFNLNKNRMCRLDREERAPHVFYQLLAGASPDERDALDLEDEDVDPTAYACLARSGCYRLPGGPASDDAAQFDELRAAMASLGFKHKHLQSIWQMLVAILLLGNIEFADDAGGASGAGRGPGDALSYESATVAHGSRSTLDRVSRMLGVDPSELEHALTNETRWLRRELCSSFLDARGAERQRDALMRNLYAILFAFVVETANRKLAPPAQAPEDEDDEQRDNKLVLLDLPGFQNRASDSSALLDTGSYNGVDELAVNLSNELLQSWLSRRAFSDNLDPIAAGATRDGIRLPDVMVVDNTACIELLRGGTLDSANAARFASSPAGLLGLIDHACSELAPQQQAEETTAQDQALVRELVGTFARHPSFTHDTTAANARTRSSSGSRPLLFGVNHYAGPCSYDARHFIEHNTDVIDSQLIALLRGSMAPFVAKLVSGPSIAAELHPLDANTVVQAQVAVTPLRKPEFLPDTQPILDESVAHPVTTQTNATMTELLGSLDDLNLWSVLCLRPNDSGHPNAIDKRRLRAQIKSMLLPDLMSRKQSEWVASSSFGEFASVFGADPREMMESRGWVEGRDYTPGNSRVWLGWEAWSSLADAVCVPADDETFEGAATPFSDSPEGARSPAAAGPFRGHAYNDSQQVGGGYGESTDDLLARGPRTINDMASEQPYSYQDNASSVWAAAGQPFRGDEKRGLDDEVPVLASNKGVDGGMTVREKPTAVEVVPTSTARKWWVRITWLFTWWIPSFLLSSVGRMKRPDVRMAWREKLTIFAMIILACGVVIFYIIVFGRLLCPNFDKAWNTSELSEHAGTDDYYAAVAGKVYDFTQFYKIQHSDLKSYPTTSAVMIQFAGQDLTDYFPVPFTQACPGLVTSSALYMQRANFTPIVDYAVHTSGALQSTSGTKLDSDTWYYDRFSPFVEQYYKGQFVWDTSDIQKQADDGTKIWAIYEKKIFDLTDYFNTVTYYSSSSGTDLPNYDFLDSSITTLFKQQPGQDITKAMNKALAALNSTAASQNLACLNNAFYLGVTDFRKTARCEVQNYLLLAFSIILMSVTAAKFLAALQLGSKRQPELLDKFVICQVPCYTEGEESLRRTIDSLAALRYDDKRKLMFIICDGNIVGSGNDRPTPRIVLDILGVDASHDPEPLLFKSIGEGSKQLNYGKVYSGLYEFEGHVVPYMVIVKVGKPSERSKPGNRGKRDSQILLLHYLNRVHFDAPMNPLELEIFHQMRNVIGIDPAFYEYIFQVDADTTVTPDSLNRLIASAADDSSIIGICGETKVANERESLTTMIQVYEYYISHHLTKAFESLFGSVTCLPGCFSVYRIRTADKGRPIIISSRVIDEYAENNVDTLHKKNLFSLGEDRYLTTLMMKHFPTFKMKFSPDAIAHTVAPSRWKVLLSQRRRWINSTVHNLVELLSIEEMCGFCCFSMRFVVLIDLVGTIILPATCVYLIYLIVVSATGKAAIPIISIAMIAAVYGLQAIIFILKREFMLIGWMLVYILAFPIYSFLLPLYSFWSMDDFSWGNTRVVVEGNTTKIISDADEHFDDSMIPLKRFSDYEAETWDQADEKNPFAGETASVLSGATGTQDNRSRLSRRPPPPGSEQPFAAGDFYRDSSPLGRPQQQQQRNTLRPAASNASFQSSFEILQPLDPRVASMAGLSQWGAGSMYGGPAASFYPAPPGSEFGGNMLGVNPYAAMQAPRNSMMRPMTMFSAAPTNANPFETTLAAASAQAPPQPPATSQSTDPSDSEIVQMIKQYLATQDLMTLTKRNAREAVQALFPNADMKTEEKTTLINGSIDRILAGGA